MAMVSLWLHCGAYVGIGHWVDALSGHMGMVGWGWCSLLALLALRLTGDLSWWLDDATAHCVQMDWENRVALLEATTTDDDDAKKKKKHTTTTTTLLQWCVWLRGHVVLRAAVFILAYPYCMESCVYVVQLAEQHWLKNDCWDTIVASLPSVVYERDYGICPAATTERSTDVSFCSAACQQDIHDAGMYCTCVARCFVCVCVCSSPSC